ncbi:hypothetical protein QP858_07960 [Trueperella bernardiae]|uniref:Uncharacterized protein n=2 Tax=Bacillati TaxID=1783272 RepID=A0AAW6ZMX0_9ACTO|nr:hypothetical protein [Micrococcus luteus]MDK8526510.1 hypothetical protein [Micrococcus luteus]MDK8602388.1 hypothetical protein [Trueperella bernardiae]
MTDLTPNHPAVRAANMGVQEWLAGDGPFDDDPVRLAHDMTAVCITAAIPHLDADDLRNTDAAEEIRTEGWLQGWAAGRDLDGDEDAIPYLRNTPAGRALMAEAWDALIESMSASGEFHDVDLRTMQRLNPYRDGEA